MSSAARKQSALQRACERGDVKSALPLLASGVRADIVDVEGWTSFGRAASRGHAGLTRVILEYGVDPKLKGSFDITALHEAAS